MLEIRHLDHSIFQTNDKISLDFCSRVSPCADMPPWVIEFGLLPGFCVLGG